MSDNTFTPNPEYLVQVRHLKQYFPVRDVIRIEMSKTYSL